MRQRVYPSPSYDLVSVPENPVPEDAEPLVVKSTGGIKLRAARWRPTGADRKTVMVILSGRTEFMEKYWETISDLRSRGFHVVAFDWRGQGGSDRLLSNPSKGHIPRFDDYLDDFDAVMKKAVAPLGDLKRHALAHSMGGAILLRALLRDDTLFERCTISAPMIGLAFERLKKNARFLVSLLAILGFSERYVPGGSPAPTMPFADNPLSTDRERHERADAVIATAPHLGIGSPTIGWVATAFAAMAELQDPETALAISTPVLIAAGAHDRITSTPIAESFASRMPNGRFLKLDGAEHEILLEQDHLRAKFWAAFDQFSAEPAPAISD